MLDSNYEICYTLNVIYALQERGEKVQYRDISQYLIERLAAIGETATSLTERLGWGAAYLHNIINGQFRPSRQRCLELAEVFGDDPNILLSLAGFYVPSEAEYFDFFTLLNSLTPQSQDMALEYLAYLKWREDRAVGAGELS